jgi:glyoxylase-like metal-dependent hydrolase (beta-lactamase superfamily II)
VFPDGYYGRYDGESGSLDAMIESLRRLSELNCDVMLPGHGSPVFTDANNHVKKSYEQASRPRY